MYKSILAVLLLIFTLGALCPAPAYGHHHRHRRARHAPIIVIRLH
jgi:hypothetical protein